MAMIIRADPITKSALVDPDEPHVAHFGEQLPAPPDPSQRISYLVSAMFPKDVESPTIDDNTAVSSMPRKLSGVADVTFATTVSGFVETSFSDEVPYTVLYLKVGDYYYPNRTIVPVDPLRATDFSQFRMVNGATSVAVSSLPPNITQASGTLHAFTLTGRRNNLQSDFKTDHLACTYGPCDASTNIMARSGAIALSGPLQSEWYSANLVPVAAVAGRVSTELYAPGIRSTYNDIPITPPVAFQREYTAGAAASAGFTAGDTDMNAPGAIWGFGSLVAPCQASYPLKGWVRVKHTASYLVKGGASGQISVNACTCSVENDGVTLRSSTIGISAAPGFGWLGHPAVKVSNAGATDLTVPITIDCLVHTPTELSSIAIMWYPDNAVPIQRRSSASSIVTVSVLNESEMNGSGQPLTRIYFENWPAQQGMQIATIYNLECVATESVRRLVPSSKQGSSGNVDYLRRYAGYLYRNSDRTNWRRTYSLIAYNELFETRPAAVMSLATLGNVYNAASFADFFQPVWNGVLKPAVRAGLAGAGHMATDMFGLPISAITDAIGDRYLSASHSTPSFTLDTTNGSESPTTYLAASAAPVLPDLLSEPAASSSAVPIATSVLATPPWDSVSSTLPAPDLVPKFLQPRNIDAFVKRSFIDHGYLAVKNSLVTIKAASGTGFMCAISLCTKPLEGHQYLLMRKGAKKVFADSRFDSAAVGQFVTVLESFLDEFGDYSPWFRGDLHTELFVNAHTPRSTDRISGESGGLAFYACLLMLPSIGLVYEGRMDENARWTLNGLEGLNKKLVTVSTASQRLVTPTESHVIIRKLMAKNPAFVMTGSKASLVGVVYSYVLTFKDIPELQLIAAMGYGTAKASVDDEKRQGEYVEAKAQTVSDKVRFTSAQVAAVRAQMKASQKRSREDPFVTSPPVNMKDVNVDLASLNPSALSNMIANGVVTQSDTQVSLSTLLDKIRVKLPSADVATVKEFIVPMTYYVAPDWSPPVVVATKVVATRLRSSKALLNALNGLGMAMKAAKSASVPNKRLLMVRDLDSSDDGLLLPVRSARRSAGAAAAASGEDEEPASEFDMEEFAGNL